MASDILSELTAESVDKEITLVLESYREELKALRALKRALEAREQRALDRLHAELAK